MRGGLAGLLAVLVGLLEPAALAMQKAAALQVLHRVVLGNAAAQLVLARLPGAVVAMVALQVLHRVVLAMGNAAAETPAACAAAARTAARPGCWGRRGALSYRWGLRRSKNV